MAPNLDGTQAESGQSLGKKMCKVLLSLSHIADTHMIFGSERRAETSIVGKARAFARERPWATATLGIVLAIAGLNTLWGK